MSVKLKQTDITYYNKDRTDEIKSLLHIKQHR
jgi:hypothetical protein